MGKDFIQEKTKGEMRGCTDSVSQLGRKCEVGGEGKSLGTSCDRCPGGDLIGFGMDESKGAGKVVPQRMKSIW